MTEQYGIPDEHWQKILSLFQNHTLIETVILFGSRAKATQRPSSDIDICLKGQIISDDIHKILLAYEDLYLPWKLDLVIWDQIENEELKSHIERVGIVILKNS